jgi:predicted Ser/Thr protein kinase
MRVNEAAPTQPTDETPERALLLARVARVLNRGNFGNPDVFLVSHEGGEWVLKDYAPRSWWIRNTVGRVVTTLESRAWRALAGHPNVPRFVARVDAFALLVEYRPGRPVSGRRAVPAGFLAELEQAIDELHRRGVVHLDLSHRSNVLVDDVGHPVLIDFGSALWLRPGSRLARCLLPWLTRADRRALAKWKAKLVAAG